MNHWPTHGKPDSIDTIHDEHWNSVQQLHKGMLESVTEQLAHKTNREEQVSMRLTVLPRVAGRKFRGN